MFLKRSILFILLLAVVSTLQGQSALVEKGIYIIDKDTLSSSDMIDLDGEWQFLWNRKIKVSASDTLPATILVPKAWDEQLDADSIPYTKKGTAIYRLLLINPEKIGGLALYFKGFYTSNYSLWINGELQVERSIYNSNEAGAAGRDLIEVPADSLIDITLQLRDIGSFHQGIRESVSLAEEGKLRSSIQRRKNWEMVEFGIIITLLLYNLFLFIQVKLRSFLVVSILCFLFMLRNSLLFDGSLIFYELFPSAQFIFAKRLEYIAVQLMIPLLPYFTHSLFGDRRLLKITYGIGIVSLILAITTVFSPYLLFVKTIYVYQFLVLLGFGIAIYHIIRAVKEKKPGGKALLTGAILAFLFIQVELLKSMEIIFIDMKGPNYGTLGIIFFLIFQSMAASRIFSQTHFDSTLMNRDLESIVTKRTEELTKTHLIKDKLFSILTHDIRGPLNSLQGLLDIINQRTLTEDQQKLYLGRIGENVRVTKNMVEDILRWSSMQMGEEIFAMQSEEVNLYQIVDLHNDYYYERIKEKSIRFKNEVPDDLTVLSDPNLLKLVFRNLISNALKFTPEKGKIRVMAVKKDNVTTISVYDSGIGIPDDLKVRLFEPDNKKRRDGNKGEKGAGIGLMLCKDLIEQNGGRIWVKDNPTGGSLFMFSIKDITPRQPQEEEEEAYG